MAVAAKEKSPISAESLRLFYADRTDRALKSCIAAKRRALFMPELIEERIKAPNDSELWKNWFTAASIRATGRTKQGNAVVVYAHVPNSFSNPANITRAIRRGLVDGAGILSKKEFQRLVGLDEMTDAAGNRLVTVVDHRVLKTSTNRLISYEDVLKHPQTIPFIGSEEKARQYLQRSKEVYSGEKFGVWYRDDLKGDDPLARLLFVGYCDGGDLDGYFGLDYGGRFVGVPVETSEKTGAEQKEKHAEGRPH